MVWHGRIWWKNSNSNRLAIHPFGVKSGKSSRYDTLSWNIFGNAADNNKEIDPPQIPDALKVDFEDHFWRLESSNWEMKFVSKEPILAESYVLMYC